MAHHAHETIAAQNSHGRATLGGAFMHLASCKLRETFQFLHIAFNHLAHFSSETSHL